MKFHEVCTSVPRRAWTQYEDDTVRSYVHRTIVEMSKRARFTPDAVSGIHRTHVESDPDTLDPEFTLARRCSNDSTTSSIDPIQQDSISSHGMPYVRPARSNDASPNASTTENSEATSNSSKLTHDRILADPIDKAKETISLPSCTALLECVDWQSLSEEFLSHRTPKAIRERWRNHLDPGINHTLWTNGEDEILFQAVREHGTCWTYISTLLPGRPELQCKNRYYATVRKHRRRQRRAESVRRQFANDSPKNADLDQSSIDSHNVQLPQKQSSVQSTSGVVWNEETTYPQFSHQNSKTESSYLEDSTLPDRGRRDSPGPVSNATSDPNNTPEILGDDNTMPSQFSLPNNTVSHGVPLVRQSGGYAHHLPSASGPLDTNLPARSFTYTAQPMLSQQTFNGWNVPQMPVPIHLQNQYFMMPAAHPMYQAPNMQHQMHCGIPDYSMFQSNRVALPNIYSTWGINSKPIGSQNVNTSVPSLMPNSYIHTPKSMAPATVPKVSVGVDAKLGSTETKNYSTTDLLLKSTSARSTPACANVDTKQSSLKRGAYTAIATSCNSPVAKRACTQHIEKPNVDDADESVLGAASLLLLSQNTK